MDIESQAQPGHSLTRAAAEEFGARVERLEAEVRTLHGHPAASPAAMTSRAARRNGPPPAVSAADEWVQRAAGLFWADMASSGLQGRWEHPTLTDRLDEELKEEYPGETIRLGSGFRPGLAEVLREEFSLLRQRYPGWSPSSCAAAFGVRPKTLMNWLKRAGEQRPPPLRAGRGDEWVQRAVGLFQADAGSSESKGHWKHPALTDRLDEELEKDYPGGRIRRVRLGGGFMLGVEEVLRDELSLLRQRYPGWSQTRYAAALGLSKLMVTNWVKLAEQRPAPRRAGRGDEWVQRAAGLFHADAGSSGLEEHWEYRTLTERLDEELKKDYPGETIRLGRSFMPGLAEEVLRDEFSLLRQQHPGWAHHRYAAALGISRPSVSDWLSRAEQRPARRRAGRGDGWVQRAVGLFHADAGSSGPQGHWEHPALTDRLDEELRKEYPGETIRQGRRFMPGLVEEVLRDELSLLRQQYPGWTQGGYAAALGVSDATLTSWLSRAEQRPRPGQDEANNIRKRPGDDSAGAWPGGQAAGWAQA